jgi:phage terminase large subunit
MSRPKGKSPTKVFQTVIDAYEDNAPIIVQSGGTSSGKTYSILQALCTIASYNSVTISIVGEDIPNLMVGAYRDIQTIIANDEFYQQQITDHNRSRRQFTFKSGSIIEFGSRSDPQDAKSGKRDILFVNEANGVPYEIFEELQVRTSRLVIIDFNPTAEFWAHERLRPNPDVIWIDTTYKDNPFIEDSVRRKIQSYEPTPENIARGTANEYRWKVYGLGEVGRLEGLVFPEFKVDATFPADYKWRVFGMDFGYTNDPTTLIEIRYAEGKLYWRQHIYETGLTNPDIAERLKDIEHPPGEVIIADSAEPKSIAELKRMGWHIKPAIKGTDSVMNGIDAIKRYPNVIHAGSRDLITEFNSYTWKKDRNGNAMNVPIDQYNHAIDAGRYALSHHLLKPKKEIEFYFA